jgi:hypothetical protein
MYSIRAAAMHFLVTPRRRLGVALTAKEVRESTPIKGDVQMNESGSTSLGRVTVEAFIMKTGAGPDILPRLLDAKVTGLGTTGLNITGVEEVDGAFYFQSWWCRFG